MPLLGNDTKGDDPKDFLAFLPGTVQALKGASTNIVVAMPRSPYVTMGRRFFLFPNPAFAP